jgi:hypothetical protein
MVASTRACSYDNCRTRARNTSTTSEPVNVNIDPSKKRTQLQTRRHLTQIRRNQLPHRHNLKSTTQV